MTTIQLQTQVSLETLLNSLKQLNSIELEEVAVRTAQLRAQQRITHLDKAETTLIETIQLSTISSETRKRIKALDKKSKQAGLSTIEHQQLMHLIDEVEQLNAHRMSLLLELANLRGVPLRQIMTDLPIEPLSLK